MPATLLLPLSLARLMFEAATTWCEGTTNEVELLPWLVSRFFTFSLIGTFWSGTSLTGSLVRLLALTTSLTGFCYWKSPTSANCRRDSCRFSLLSRTKGLGSCLAESLTLNIFWRLRFRLVLAVWVSWWTRLRLDLELRLVARPLGITVD